MAGEKDDLICCFFSYRRVLNLLFFSFKAFLEKMKVSIEGEDNPLDASLEKVIPGLFEWHSVTNRSVNELGNKLEGLASTVQEAIVAFRQDSEDRGRQSKKQLARTFVDIAKHLLARDVPVVKTSRVLGATVPPEQEGLLEDMAVMDDDVEFDLLMAGDSTEEEEEQSPTHVDHISFRMATKHQRLSDLWDEWHGEGKCEDSYGGTHGRDLKFGKAWRKHLSAHQYSRTNRIIYGIKVYADVHKTCVPEAIERLQQHWDMSKNSVSNFVKYLQAIGAVEKKKVRGKAKSMMSVGGVVAVGASVGGDS